MLSRMLVAILALADSFDRPTAAQAAETSDWRTEFGPLSLTLDDDDHITGVIPSYQGRFEGTLDRAQQSISGIWTQPKSAMRCNRAVSGSLFWGQATWTLSRDDTLTGVWSYCDNRTGSAGTWNGVLVGGVNPLDVATLNEDMPPPSAPLRKNKATNAAPTNTTGHAPPDTDDVRMIARFLWGQMVSPANLRSQSADVTCDGRPDHIVMYLNLDNPDGPFLNIAVQKPGDDLEALATTSLEFGTGTMASLCGEPRLVDMTVIQMEPESVLDLTGYTSPPLCPRAIRLDDGMCDSIWILTKPGEYGLTDLVVGRN